MYKLLIVDDSMVQVKSLMHYLDWESHSIYEIRTAVNGRQGLEIYREFLPDIILVDVSMPVMDGLEMAQGISKRDGLPRIIYMSCYDRFEYLQEALETGGTSYLLKPIDKRKLEIVIETAIREIECLKSAREGKNSPSYLRMLRESLLYYMMYSDSINVQYLEKMYRETGLDEFRQYLVIKFELLENGEKVSESHIIRCMQKMKEQMTNFPETIAVLDGNEKLVLLLMEKSGCEESFIQYARNISAECISCAKENDGLLLSAGISSTGKSTYDIQFLIRQASGAVNNILNSNYEKVCEYKGSKNMGEIPDVAALKEKVKELVIHSDEEKYRKFAEEYCFLGEYEMDAYGIETRYVCFVAALQIFLNEQKITDMELLDGVEFSIYKSGRIKTVEQLNQWIYNILRILNQYMKRNAKHRVTEIVSQITAYINENYASIISVEQLAKNCYISASYARWVFKQVNGKTIYEYLMMVRMDRAKQLLKGRMPVYEVAKQVGYKSKANFVSAFKKYTGMLPGQFSNVQNKRDS